MATLTEEDYFAPPEAQQDTGSLRTGATGEALNPWEPTSGGSDLQGQAVDLGSALLTAFTGVPISPQELQALIDGITAFANWIAGFFEGVPNSAKTMGAGQIAANEQDSLTRWIGLNLMRGANQNRTLSEPNWPQNFGGRILAMGGAMISFVNREPPSNYWRVHNTAAASVTRFSDPPRQFKLQSLPPPNGAPYNANITIDGFFAQNVLSASDYQLKYGYQIPTAIQIAQFLKSGKAPLWDDGNVKLSQLHNMIDDFLNEWTTSYQQWLAQQPTTPPGTPVDPCFGTQGPPCPPAPDNKGDQLTDLISGEMTYLYFIAVALQQLATAAQSPADQVCCANINASIQAVSTALRNIQNELNSDLNTPIDFTGLQNSILTLNSTVASFPPLWNSLGTATQTGLMQIATAIKSINVTVDNQAIVDALNKLWAQGDVPDTILQQFKADKLVPDAYAPFLQGMPWPALHAILKALAFFSPPIGAVEKWLNDPDDANAADRARIADIKWLASTMWRELTGVAGIPAGDFSKQLQVIFSKFLSANDPILEPLITPLINSVKQLLLPPAGYSPGIGDIGVDSDKSTVATTGVALTAALAAWGASYGGIDAGESLTRMAEIFAGAVGWEHLRDVDIGPLVRNGIGAVADLNAKKTFRQWNPSIGETLNLYARGIITKLNAEQILPYSAVPDGSMPFLEAAAFHGLQPRQLIRAFESGLFTNADLTDEMTFSGMRPASQARMLLLAPYLASNTERNEYKSAIVKAFEAGHMDQPTFSSSLADAEHNTDPASLRFRAASVNHATSFINELRNAYQALFINGFIDQPTYQADLTSLGIPSANVAQEVTLAVLKKQLIDSRFAQSQERTLERQTIAIERRTALENYKSGNLNLAGLEAALIATGTDAIQAAAFGALADAQLQGTQSWQYGLQVTPQQKQLLIARVADLTDQRKREMIDGTFFIQQLQALNLPEEWQNALLARANALITPKSDALLSTVETGKGPSQRRG